jgi:hypothetical protein
MSESHITSEELGQHVATNPFPLAAHWIDPSSGNRVNAPVVILGIDAAGNYVIDPTWAESAGFSLPGQ